MTRDLISSHKLENNLLHFLLWVYILLLLFLSLLLPVIMMPFRRRSRTLLEPAEDWG